jgi:hypothetical protein
MEFFQILLSFEFTSSLIVLGSSLVIDKEKIAQKSGGTYLFGCLLSLIDILNIGVRGYSYSDSTSFVDSHF